MSGSARDRTLLIKLDLKNWGVWGVGGTGTPGIRIPGPYRIEFSPVYPKLGQFLLEMDFSMFIRVLNIDIQDPLDSTLWAFIRVLNINIQPPGKTLGCCRLFWFGIR